MVAVDGDIDAAEASPEAAREAGVPVIALKTEALDPVITGHIVDTAIQRVWQIDILVNNTSRLDDVSAEGGTDWTATMAVNREASHRFAWSVLPGMRKRRTGMIVTAAWCWGDGGDPAEPLARDTSGAVVAQLTGGLAASAAADGIACYALLPRPGGGDAGPRLVTAGNGSTTMADIDAPPEQVAEWVTLLAGGPHLPMP